MSSRLFDREGAGFGSAPDSVLWIDGNCRISAATPKLWMLRIYPFTHLRSPIHGRRSYTMIFDSIASRNSWVGKYLADSSVRKVRLLAHSCSLFLNGKRLHSPSPVIYANSWKFLREIEILYNSGRPGRSRRATPRIYSVLSIGYGRDRLGAHYEGFTDSSGCISRFFFHIFISSIFVPDSEKALSIQSYYSTHFPSFIWLRRNSLTINLQYSMCNRFLVSFH